MIKKRTHTNLKENNLQNPLAVQYHYYLDQNVMATKYSAKIPTRSGRAAAAQPTCKSTPNTQVGVILTFTREQTHQT